MRSSFSFLACLIVGRVASHPLCYIDDKPTDLNFDLTFCPEAQDGACCTDVEEENVSNIVDMAGILSDECGDLYKEVVCGVCHSYSAHLYERLGAELGSLDGMTMKQEFCDDLVSACSDEIPAIGRTYPGGLSYCEKHVGPTGDQFWSYPYEEPIFLDSGLVDVFPGLDNDFPEATISMRQTPDGSSFWLTGQQGEIKKVPTNDLDKIDNVVDISDNGVFYVAFEEGLLDMTFDPMFGITGTPDYFYLSYTVQLNDGENPRNRISKFEYFEGDTSATLASEEPLITTVPKFSSIHSAGWCGFKPSDYGDGNDAHDLYWTTGDGGPLTDDLNTGQDTTNVLGSMIRITVPSDGTGFTIPSGNLGSLPDVRPEICASGFRNPFRCSFDRETDVLYCGDVGHTNVEEIDIVECGNNYGWSRFEGSRCQEAQEDRDGDCQGASRNGYTFPFFEYCHPDYFSEGDEDQFTGNQDICGDRRLTGHAVIGGYVYRGQFFSDVLTGAYIFGDANNRNIYYLKEVEGELVFGTIVTDGSVAIISFSEDINGELMLLTRNYDILHMPCGDLCATTCLEQSEDNVEAIDQGCYMDNSGDRVLTLAQSNCGDGERAMSSQICASYCDTLGAKYAGVQFSFQCFCGNNDDFDRLGSLPQSSCEMLCTANPDEFCGGIDAVQVYEVFSTIIEFTPSPTMPFEFTPSPGGIDETPAPIPGIDEPTPAPAPIVGVDGPGTPRGCFLDTIDGRIMTMTATQTPMGSAVCQAICIGSLFYGTQNANECWCGGQRTDFDVHGPATNCDMPCAGNTGETCGGRLAMTVYENNGDGGESTPAPVIVEPPTPAPVMVTDPTPSPILIMTPAPILILPTDDDGTPAPVSVGGPEFLGCFGDVNENRIMTGPNTASTMSAEICAGICGSTVYGTQNASECWCGNDNTDFDTHGPATCDFECANNPGEFCGGRDAMSVYSSGTGNPNPAPVPAPAPEAAPVPDTPGGGFTFVGCFADLQADRIMIDQISSNAMTSENCAAQCGGRPFFGTQFGRECWCGEDNDFGRHGTATCNFDCSGDASETCGGTNAMSVYSTS